MAHERILRAATSDDAVALRVLLTSHSATAEFALARHLAQPRYRPALTRVVEQNGELLGAALISHRRLRLGLATIESVAIDALLLGPDLPRDELLGDCVGTCYDEGLPLALISGAANEFAAAGFARYQFAVRSRLPANRNANLRLRAATPADVSDIAALYEASYRHISLAESRVMPDWPAWLHNNAVVVLEDSRQRVGAYAVLYDDGVVEAGAADSGTARELLSALGAASTAQHLALPGIHSVTQAALQLGSRVQVRGYNDAEPAPLAGIVDLPGLLGQISPELERRLALSRYAGWEGSLRFELAAERVTLVFAQGRATVFDGTRPADIRLRQVELPALAQLCLGYRTAADLRATGELRCDDTVLGLIDAIFPNIALC